MDEKYFYLNNMMDRLEYIMIKISMIPQEFVENTISRKNYTMDTYLHGQLRECMDYFKQDG